MILRRLLIILLVLAGQSIDRADEFQKTGTTGFVFLEVPVTPRYTALGETGITLPDAGNEGLFINPALAAGQIRPQGVLFSYGQWYTDISQQALAFTYHRSGLGTLGLSCLYVDYGQMDRTANLTADLTGSYVALGHFDAHALMIGISLARYLTDKFAFGTSLKYAREKIDRYQADNLMADIGFLYHTGYRGLRIGAFLQNFGLESKYAVEKFKMPQLLKLGISAEVWGRIDSPSHLTMLAEAVHPNDADERIQLGGECVLSDILALRAGYKFGYQHEGLTAGFGLRLKLKGYPVFADFSFMQHEYLDNTLRYSLRWEF